MQDDPKKIEDEDFDDLEFEDLDDDFADEDWDELDEGDDTPAAAPDNASGKAPAEKPAKAAMPMGGHNKTFLQKYFNVIVIAIAVLGGGAFMMAKFGGGTGQAPQGLQAPMNSDMAALSDVQDAIPELSSDMPPMPAPMDSANAGDMSADDFLTPMPEPQETAGQDTLPDLNLSDLDSADLELSGEISAATGEEQEDPLALDEQLSATLANTIGDEMGDTPTTAAQNAPDLGNIEMPAAQEPSQEPAPEPVAEVAPAIDFSAQNAEIDSLKMDLQERDAALSVAEKAQAELKSELQGANAEIDEMSTTIQGLESKIAMLEGQLKAQNQAPVAAPAPKAPEPVKAAPTTPAVPAPKPVVAATPKPAAAPVQPAKTMAWVLRSARPGEATLAETGSNDIRQVEVGSMLPGLGKIQSIGIENGRWVVVGTQGRVTQ